MLFRSQLCMWILEAGGATLLAARLRLPHEAFQVLTFVDESTIAAIHNSRLEVRPDAAHPAPAALSWARHRCAP